MKSKKNMPKSIEQQMMKNERYTDGTLSGQQDGGEAATWAGAVGAAGHWS